MIIIGNFGKNNCYIDLEKLDRKVKTYTKGSIRPPILFMNEMTRSYLVSQNCLTYKCDRDSFGEGFFYKNCLIEINEFLDFGGVKIY